MNELRTAVAPQKYIGILKTANTSSQSALYGDIVRALGSSDPEMLVVAGLHGGAPPVSAAKGKKSQAARRRKGR